MRICLPTWINDDRQEAVNAAYVDYISGAGAMPVLIASQKHIHEFADICDGLILPGGIDVEPTHYRFENTVSFNVDPWKDEFERDLFHAFRELGKPVFGICRGFQLIFLEFMEFHEDQQEGRKYEDYIYFCFNVSNHAQTTSLKVPRNVPSHMVDAIPSGLYYSEENTPQVMRVNSMHHQCVVEKFDKAIQKAAKGKAKKSTTTRIGKFRKLAWTERGLTKDDIKIENIVEAFSISDWGGPIMAVQWHPEELKDFELIQKFFGIKQKEIEESL